MEIYTSVILLICIAISSTIGGFFAKEVGAMIGGVLGFLFWLGLSVM